ncbi:MAG TPA: hypothetical protein PLV77_02735 [Solirubrobacterales bacterium]|nr:hypothetical protein [Solirubrobacterales bacterium]
MPETVSGESSANVSAFETQEPTHRVLLVADEVFRGSDLADELAAHGTDRGSIGVFVISPAMTHSLIDQELGNVDQTVIEASDRLETILAELRKVGISARGEVGDADPMVAIGDGVREFEPDQIMVVTHVDSEREYAEKNLWDRLGTDFHAPVTQLKVPHPAGGGGIPAVESVEHFSAHQRTEEEIQTETRNFPPLKKMDIAGILIGFIGTVALGMVAVAVGTEDGGGNLSGSAAIVLLIAMGAFLINVAHIVGLLFFESVRYSGIWQKFMARLSIGITTIGLAVSLVLWLA